MFGNVPVAAKPSRVPSAQPASFVHLFAVHTRLAQSGPALHASPFAQTGHVPPPQSTSVSSPSFTPFEHDAPPAGGRTPFSFGAVAVVSFDGGPESRSKPPSASPPQGTSVRTMTPKKSVDFRSGADPRGLTRALVAAGAERGRSDAEETQDVRMEVGEVAVLARDRDAR